MPREKQQAQQRLVRQPPATTVEARENQLIAMAYDHAQKQFEEGTASSQLTTHFLKAGTAREELEREKLRKENLLIEAKIQAMASQQNMEELQAEAIEAMTRYSGRGEDVE